MPVSKTAARRRASAEASAVWNALGVTAARLRRELPDAVTGAADGFVARLREAAPAPAPAAPPPGLRPVPVLGPLGIVAFRAGRSLHGSALVDRLLRGRGWIGLLAVLLIGLVFLNVSLLKLNAQAGRNAEQAKVLRSQNDRLHAKVTRLTSEERIEAAGRKLGLVMPAPDQVRYLSIGSGDGRRAARMIRSDEPGLPPSEGIVKSVPDEKPMPAAGTTPAPGTPGAEPGTQPAVDPTGATPAAGVEGAPGAETQATPQPGAVDGAPATGVAPAPAAQTQPGANGQPAGG